MQRTDRCAPGPSAFADPPLPAAGSRFIPTSSDALADDAGRRTGVGHDSLAPRSYLSPAGRSARSPPYPGRAIVRRVRPES